MRLSTSLYNLLHLFAKYIFCIHPADYIIDLGDNEHHVYGCYLCERIISPEYRNLTVGGELPF